MLFRTLILLLSALALAPPARAQTSFTIEAPSTRSQRLGWEAGIPVRPAPNYVSGRLLAANTAESVTVPAAARFAVFSADCNFYANGRGAAAVLNADVDNGTASEMNPSAWYFGPAELSAISVIAAATCRVTVSFGQ